MMPKDLSDEQRIHWVNNKRNLLLALTKKRFEEAVYEKLERNDNMNFEELDEWLDDQLTTFLDQRNSIQDKYDGILKELGLEET